MSEYQSNSEEQSNIQNSQMKFVKRPRIPKHRNHYKSSSERSYIPPPPQFMIFNHPQYPNSQQVQFYPPIISPNQELQHETQQNQVLLSTPSEVMNSPQHSLANPIIQMQPIPLQIPPYNMKMQKPIKPFLDLRKTKMCLNFTTGYCAKGDACTFAHSLDDLKARPDLNKTKLCEDFEKTGSCTYENCVYAHGIEELRHTEDVYKTALCYNFTNEGKCELGEKCRYAHGIVELRTNQKEGRGKKYNKYKFNNNSNNAQHALMLAQSNPSLINHPNSYFVVQYYVPEIQTASEHHILQ